MNTQTAVRFNWFANRPFYTRLAALGFALVSLGGLVYLSLNITAMVTGELIFLVVIVGIGLLVAGLLLRFGTWALVLAALLSLLLLLAVVPFTTFTLLHPEGGTDFIPILFIIAGSGLGFTGSVVRLIQRKRKVSPTSTTPAEALGLRVFLAALSLLTLASLVLTATARTTLSAQSKANAISVEIKDFKYNPDALQVKAGDTVRLAVKNNDTTLHTFTMMAAGVDASIPPGAERLIEFQAPAPGTYQWYCIPHSDSGAEGRTGMVGSLIVNK